MSFIVESRRKKAETLTKAYPDAILIDVTSKGDAPFIKFSPFYPHGGIPVPFSEGLVAASVEGIWQGLKVFETADIDTAQFENTSMKNIKRTTRKNGRIIGHRNGVNGQDILSYHEARYKIYLPSYLWVLENCLQNEVKQLKELGSNELVVLLDYETNCDVDNLSKPLSHAGLVKAYLENHYPA